MSLPLRQFRRSQAGFTLIDLMVTIVVIGILATIGSANYIRMQKNAKRASCVANQHSMMVMGTLYGAEQNAGTLQINVQTLRNLGYASPTFGECPDSPVADFDDYTADLVEGMVVDCTCMVRGNEHPFQPGH